MPQIKPAKQQAQQLISVNGAKLFRERLVDRFKAHEFVRVINIDDEPFRWQYMPSNAEETDFDSGGLHRQVSGRRAFTADYKYQTPGNEQDWVINPGASEVLVGENAYLFIEGLYKRLVSKKVIADTPDQEVTKPRNFNWNDGTMQEAYIDKILIGVERPNFNDAPTAKKA